MRPGGTGGRAGARPPARAARPPAREERRAAGRSRTTVGASREAIGATGVIGAGGFPARVPLDDVDDHPGQFTVRVGAAEGGGGLGHARHPVDVEQHGQQGVADPFRCEVGVLDEQAAAAGHDGLGVEPLLAVPVRQRDERAGQPDRGELGAGHGAGPAEREVGGGVGQVHPVHVGHRDVGRPAGIGQDVGRVARAGHVQDLHPGGTQPANRAEEGVVQRLGPLRAPGHEQHGQIWAEAEVRPGLVAQREPVQLGDLAPDRDAQEGGVRQLGAGVTGEDMVGEPGAELVGQAGPRVRLVHHDRDVPAASRQVRRRRHVAAEADQHVRLYPVEHPRGRADGAGQPPGHREQPGSERARHGHGRDQREFVPAHRHEPGLQATLGAQADHHGAGVGLAKRISQRKRRFNMSGGSATG